MISWIKGELVNSWQSNNKYFILLNCQGLGYEIQTLESVILNINLTKNPNEEIILWLKHIKKEDSDLLFGFVSMEEREFFNEILNIKGVGSQIGMSLLNKFSIEEIINAIANKDKKTISSVQGIGEKMTDRIFLELKSKINIKHKENDKENEKKDKFDFLVKNSEIDSIFQDIDLTLQSLNYTKTEIKSLFPLLIKDIQNNKKSTIEKDSLSFESLLKLAMNYLDRNTSNLVQ